MKRLLCPVHTNDNQQYYVYKRYIEFFKKHDIEVVIINPCSADLLKVISSYFDGCLFCGGKDIDPKYYKEALHQNTSLEDREIDLFEFDVLNTFYQQNKGCIGICRGFQLINVYFGGTLNQDILSTHDNNHLHLITFKKTNKKQYVNSYHHQAINKIAPNLQPIAISNDGIIEAFEGTNIFATQWHFEMEHGASPYCINKVKQLLFKNE